MYRALVTIVFFLSYISGFFQMYGGTVRLTSNGKAMLPIVIAEDAEVEMVRRAQQLSEYLQRITGATFDVVKGREQKGIVLGIREQFPEILTAPEKGAAPTWKERYRLYSSDEALYIIGETSLAVQHGVFDLLHLIGYRQYFPHPIWEIVPHKPNLEVSVDRTEEPGYATRSLFHGNVTDPLMQKVFKISARESMFNAWKRKNRAISGFTLNTYHNWHRIARRHPEAFRANPDWITGVQDKPWEEATAEGWKFRVENEELRKLLREDMLQWFEENPDATSFSIDPTDGRGWPTDSPIGSPSDQMVYLANDLIETLQKVHPDKKIAFYGYHMHSPPPSLQLKPGAIVSVATGFIVGGYSIEELMLGWRAKGAELGVRDYMNVFGGSYDMPGSNYIGFAPERAAERIRKQHEWGARYWISESDSAWVPLGLATYISMRALWDPYGASAEGIRDEFLQLCFGKAVEPIGRFYALIDGANHPLVSSDLMARMYDAVAEGLSLESDPLVRERIYQLAIYTRYVELMYQYLNTSGDEQLEAYLALAEWAIRYRNSWVFNPLYIFGRLASQNEKMRTYAARYMEKPLEPLSEQDLINIILIQRESLPRISFEPATWSQDLQRAGMSGFENRKVYEMSRTQTLLWLADKAGDELELTIRGMGGRVKDAPPIEVSITHVEDPLDAPAATAQVIGDKTWYTVRLKADLPGQYKVRIQDPANYLEIHWPEGTPMVFPASLSMNSSPRNRTPWDAWFYLPAGTELLAGYADSSQGRIVDMQGNVLYDFSEMTGPGYFEIGIIPPSQPHVLKFEKVLGKRLLMTVPPYIARRPDELIVPVEALPTNDKP